MIKKIIILFKIARKLAQSDAIKIISKFREPPKIIKIFSYFLSFSFSLLNLIKCIIFNSVFYNIYYKLTLMTGLTMLST